MNFEFRNLLSEDFSPDSRVWIYQSSRCFSISEALQVEEILSQFTKEWKSHGNEVQGTTYLFFGQFIIFIADELATKISGCSTDSSVRVMKEIETALKVNLFDRNQLAFIVKDKIELLPLSQFNYAFSNKFITSETLYFNNSVQSKTELEESWIIPIQNSWLTKKIPPQHSTTSVSV